MAEFGAFLAIRHQYLRWAFPPPLGSEAGLRTSEGMLSDVLQTIPRQQHGRAVPEICKLDWASNCFRVARILWQLVLQVLAAHQGPHPVLEGMSLWSFSHGP
jgi:hypothetical protein